MSEASADPPPATPPGTPPGPVLAAARARADARAARDFATADRLRAEIETAGWKVVDQGIDFRLEQAHPPDVADDGKVRYGASTSVPSRLGEAPSATATIVVLATDWPGDLDRALAGIAAHAPDNSQLVIVADDPSPAQAEALEAIGATESPVAEGAPEPPMVEVVWTSARLGTAAAIDCGLRRAVGRTVVLLDTSLEPTGDFVSPLLTALDDPSVAVTGGWGIVSDDLRTFRDAPAGDVDAIEGYCQAFRRTDVVLRGPLDERFRYYRNLDIWWSLVLRDQGPDAPPRRALAIDGLPFIRHEHRGYASLPAAERDRLSKRNFYRILDRFGSRRDLLVTHRPS